MVREIYPYRINSLTNLPMFLFTTGPDGSLLRGKWVATHWLEMAKPNMERHSSMQSTFLQIRRRN